MADADPLFPTDEPRRFDSLVERRFAADLLRAAPDGDLIRDPQPLAAGRSLVFPDFALVIAPRPSAAGWSRSSASGRPTTCAASSNTTGWSTARG